MRHLVVYANPRPQSFCHAVLMTAVTTLREEGHDVMVRDLYALDFDPVLRTADLQETGSLPPEIRAEQFYIRAAEVITFIYPVWWTNMPAIMKGYIDRVFSYNFAYTMLHSGPVGLLKGKQVIIFSSQSSREDAYHANGMFSAMKKVTDEGIFSFSGMEVVEHTFFSEVDNVSALVMDSYFGRVRDSMKRFAIAGSFP